MGFYIRRAFRLGPLRLNVSKSGVGLSAGVRGARVGVGPRGAYIHVGRGGLYYRQNLGRIPGAVPLAPPANPSMPQAFDSAPATEIRDPSASDLLAQLSRIHLRFPLFPAGLVLLVVLVATCLFLAFRQPESLPSPEVRSPEPRLTPTAEILRDSPAPPPHPSSFSWWPANDSQWWRLAAAAVFLLSVPVLIRFHRLDSAQGSAELTYDLELDVQQRFARLRTAFHAFATSGRTWLLRSQTTTGDWKRQAGAPVVVSRQVITPTISLPRRIRCNLEIPALPAGSQTLYFFPDRILVYDSSGVGGVPYRELSVTYNTVNFREGESLPSDAQVVGTTWQYVNKHGAPDRRYTNNLKVSIVRYGEMVLQSVSGLNEAFQCSDPDASNGLARALEDMR